LDVGDIFEVVFNITVDGEASFPISEIYSLNNLLYKPGVSYASWDGENWVDLYNFSFSYSSHWYASQVACIKAFTFLNEINTTTTLTAIKTGTDSANITVEVVDEYGNPIKSAIVQMFVNGIGHDVEIKNGYANLVYRFNETSNNVYVLFNRTGYVSSSDEGLINFSKVDIDLDLNITRALNNLSVVISSGIDITEEIILTVNGNTTKAMLVDGVYRFNLTDLSNGIYNISAQFSNESIYVANVSDSVVIEIRNTTLTAQNVTITDEDFIFYNVTLTDDMGVALPLKVIHVIIGEVEAKYTTDLNGTVHVPVSLNCGNYTVEVFFEGDNDYIKSSKTTWIFVKTKVDISLDLEMYANNVTVNVTLSKQINDTMTLTVNGRPQTVEVLNGTAVYRMDDMKNGEYVIRAFLDPVWYEFNDASAEFLINVSKTKIISNYISVYENNLGNFTVRMVDENSNPVSGKTIIFTLNGTAYYNITDESGRASLIFNLKKGDYFVDCVFEGDDYYLKSYSSNTINVKALKNVSMIVDVNDMMVGENATAYISFNQNVEGNVSVIVCGWELTIPISGLKANFTLSNLSAGSHEITVTYSGDSTHNPANATKTVNVYKYASKITNMAVSDDASLTAYLVFENAMPIPHAEIIYTVNGTWYNTTTDDDGRFTLSLGFNSFAEIYYMGNESVGKFNTTMVIDDLNKMRANTSILADDYDTYAIDYYAGERGNYFRVQLVDAKGNALSKKPVKIGFNGKTYNTTTDEAGWAQLQINLAKAGTYTFAVAFLGDDDYNGSFVVQKINVFKKKTGISASSKSYKASAKTKSYTVTLKTVPGSSIDGKTYLKSGKKITLTVNGKSYSAKTNDKGQATFKLNLNRRGSYSAVIKFEGDDTYAQTSTTSKITLTN
jgi:hypothetical protein